MAGRRTNLALLLLTAAALATGIAALAIGRRPDRFVLIAHGAAGLGLLMLSPWKSVIVRRGIRRSRQGRDTAVLLAVLVIIVVGTGLLHSASGYVQLGSVSAMQVHIGTALLVLPLLVWHVRSRWQRPRRTDFSRRNALRLGTLAAGAGAGYVVLERVTAIAGLPGRDRRFTGSFDTGSFRPATMPVTQWLTDAVPTVNADEWRLQVRGAGSSRSWSYAELAAGQDILSATLDCTGGWYAEQEWTGIRLDRLLPGGTRGRSFEVVSVTGYRRRLPLDEAGGMLLATRLGADRLSPGHGYPVRLVVPGRRGFWWVKWVTAIEVSDEPWWLQPPFPLQ